MIYYKCKYFKIQELIDPATYNKWGERAWMFFNPHVLYSLDMIREHFQVSVTVNNWLFGGKFTMRGLRPPTSTVGAIYGQHRFGNAIDCDVKNKPAEEVRQEILKLKNNDRFQYITCLEADVAWVHFDTRNIENRIMLVYPT